MRDSHRSGPGHTHITRLDGNALAIAAVHCFTFCHLRGHTDPQFLRAVFLYSLSLSPSPPGLIDGGEGLISVALPFGRAGSYLRWPVEMTLLQINYRDNLILDGM